MRQLSVILTLLFLTTINSFGEKGQNAETVDVSYYGFGISQIHTGSGHGNGYAICGNITKGRKAIEAGIIYSERESKFAGGDFKYKIYFRNISKLQDNKTIFKPYIQYNIVYQKGMSASPDVVYLGEKTVVIEDTEPGQIATIGHYLCYGNRVKVMGNAYFESSLGFGVYQGSLDKVNGPGTFGIHKDNYGFTYSFKLGFGYTFK
jgi:hypothetical protein